MNIEHIALNVADPVAMTAWYTEHLGMEMVRGMHEPPYTRFLADEGRNVVIEIYRHEHVPVPGYAEMDPLTLHVAFSTPDADIEIERLTNAGAHLVEDQHLPDGTRLVMLRDPWGLAIQLCQRSRPLLAPPE